MGTKIMSRKFISALSGTYNVHANEIARGGVSNETQNGQSNSSTLSGFGFTKMASLISGGGANRPAPIPETVKCVVHFLDDTEHLFEVDRSAKGEELMELVFRHLELIEREYFALQFVEVYHHRRPITTTMATVSDYTEAATMSPRNSYSNNNEMTVYNKWLDPTKKIRKQMQFHRPPYSLYFRIKFYVTDMSRLLEEYTRYHFYLQLRKDILHGRLQGDEQVLATLASYVLQSELGDYSEEEHKLGYSNQIQFIPNQTDDFMAKVESLHRLHQGQTPADAELNYLEGAKCLELYGVDLHDAKDCEQQDILIGVSSNGLTIFKNHIKINIFSWAKIVKISFKRRYFFIQLKHEGTERYDQMVGFNLCSYRACKSLWKSCVEQHTFFRLHTPKPLTKKFFFFFSLGAKFRYSGKTEFQTIEENRKRLTRTERIFIRNNTRTTATMPSFQHNKQSYQSKITDAQKHIANLKLSTITSSSPSKLDNSVVAATSSNAALNEPSTVNHFNNNLHKQLPIGLSSLSSSLSSSSSTPSSSSSSLFSCESVLDRDSVADKNNKKTPSLIAVVSHRRHHHHRKSGSMALNNVNDMTIKSSCSASQNHHHYSNHRNHDGHSRRRKSDSNISSSANDSSESFGTTKHDLIKKPCDITNGHQHHQQPKATAKTTNATVIPIESDVDLKTTTTAKFCSISSSNNTNFTSSPFTPTNLISSLPFIDDRASLTTTNSIENSTITEELNEFKLNNNKRELDSPIRDLINQLYDVASSDIAASNNNATTNESLSENESPVHVVTVKMRPDPEGRFGFNVKGGNDQNCPVLVSRVAPNTPADNAEPNKLHEGDQVLAINEIDVSGMSHEQVVQLIRSTKDLGPEAELVLSIRPNVYYQRCCKTNEENSGNETEKRNVVDEEDNEESPLHYTPADLSQSFLNQMFSSQLNEKSSTSMESMLDVSMNLLREGLLSDLLIIQFEYLPRRNEDETITVARFIENVPKNRYLDIAPYDSTRVILDDCLSGDYINASYVVMRIEASSVENRYIATQGPLKRTTSDFWLMVWQQRSTIIVMVTPLVEDGRKKCFKYWPDEDQTVLVNDRYELVLKSITTETAYVERLFEMTDIETKKTHQVTQLQYLAWPDQGVPDDDADFLSMIMKIRQLRSEAPDRHVIVHCSAGIGRTGVLILMETGLCLIEANQPVYPLELIRQMRTQRAMLIQTSTQFRFVCEAFLKVYTNRIVKPLPEFLPKIDDH